MVDTIQGEEAEKLALPVATIQTLRTVGLPHELRLAGWLGPTLFSSEIGDGRLSESKHGYLIGSIRETMLSTGVYARFWIQRGTGAVFLESSDSQEPRPQFVNSGVDSFVHLLNHFCTAWNAIADFSDDTIESLIQGLISEIKRADPVALKDADNYWPGWVEELSSQSE